MDAAAPPAPAPVPAPTPTPARRWLRPLAWAAVLAVLGLTFSAYLNPHLARDLADWVWACFG
jgi:ferric-dicitrate binding protein FerR (iron transport regulator)